MNTIFDRRSIRKYQEKRVEDEKVERILRAAMQAPSAGNQQGWEFIVVRDKETLTKLADISPYSKMIGDSDVTIIVLGNKGEMKWPQYWEQDLGAATQNLILQAVEEGLGSVWLGVAPEKDRMTYVREIFDLPEGVEPFAAIPMGYPVGENKFIDRWDEKKVHFENY